MSEARDSMVAATATLLSTVGLEGTSFSTVLATSGAPRGSIYYHFPEGKEQLVLAAVDAVGQGVLSRIRGMDASTAEEIVRSFAQPWRDLLVGSEFRAGCAVASVVRAEKAAAAGVFARWSSELAVQFTRAGMSTVPSARLAGTVVATVEGALLIAQSSGDIGGFDDVIEDLVELASIRSRADGKR